jgi:hypothetical protein
MRVSALVRRVHDAGGSAMVLARGDATGGGVLVLLLDRGTNPRFRERGLSDGAGLIESGPIAPDPSAAADYWQRRRARDPDLWVVEVDVADGARFADETIAVG